MRAISPSHTHIDWKNETPMKKQPKQDCILLSRIIFLAEFVRFKTPGKTAVTIVVIESIGIVVFCASADYA